MAQDSELLCRSAKRGDLARVQALLQSGADPNARNEAGETPLVCAVSLESRAGPYDSRDKMAPDHLGAVRFLLEHGADANGRDTWGRTALLAAMLGSASEYKIVGSDESVARLLLAHGANVKLRRRSGMDAAADAARPVAAAAPAGPPAARPRRGDKRR